MSDLLPDLPLELDFLPGVPFSADLFLTEVYPEEEPREVLRATLDPSGFLGERMRQTSLTLEPSSLI